MDKDVTDGIMKDYEGHWSDFKRSFQNTYMDLAKSINTEKDLKELHMKEGNIDTYIATFKKLAKLASYNEREHSLMSIFKKGLPNGLALHIIQNSSIILETLKGWMTEARQQQLRYLQSHEFTRKALSPHLLALQKKLSVRNNNNQRHHPDAMDVDSGNITQFTWLTDAKRETLKAQGACFRCCKQGHMSRQCPLKQGGNAEYERPAPSQQSYSGVTDPVEEPQKKDVNSLLNEVRECLKEGDNKQKFFNRLIESDFA
jgi:hypothetical protein